VVSFVEIKISAQLTGEVSDWEPAGSFQRRKKIISGENPAVLLSGPRVSDNGFQQFECAAVTDSAGESLHEEVMVDGGEVPANVSFEDPGEFTQHLAGSLYCQMLPFTGTAGPRVENEAAFKQWFDHAAECLLYHAIGIRGGTDESTFWVAYFKGTHRSRAPCFLQQLVANVQQAVLQIKLKTQNIGSESPTSSGTCGSAQQIRPGDDLPQQIEVPFHQ